MKKTYYLISLPVALLLLGLTQSFSGGEHGTRTPTGAPAGHTGSPGDGQNCTVCHGGTATQVSGILTSDVPASGYLAGQTYNFTVTLAGTGRKGFQASPQNQTGTLLGTLTAGAGNQLVGFNNKYVTHSIAQNTQTATWNFQWTAPVVPGTGNVTMYIAGVISQPNVRLSSLLLSENYSVGISETQAGISRIYPNPGSASVYLDFDLNKPGVVKAGIYTLSGSFTGAGVEQFSGSGSSHLMLNHQLPQGTYILRIYTPDGLANRKIVVL